MKTSYRFLLRSLPLFLSGALGLALTSPCQTSPLPNAPQPQGGAREAATIRNSPRNFLKDQEAIWTSPAHLSGSNALGPVVLVLATTVLATTDHQVMSSHFTDKTLNDHASTASTGLTGLMIAAPVAFFAVGEMGHRNQAAETGILGGEAMLDSLAVNYAVKAVSMRERPTLDGARGKFFQTSVGLDSSFPSNHAIVAWSSAAVIASEYPGWATQLTVYGLATGVSISRVVARQHFPSDVLVGSAVGWMIGRYVYHRHHRY
ncbi:MAG TPA: phosphatase PAP2 family protein [Terracidiphilus sp.]|nr:phosphatase PAP2 family protein [Terracidiphilus sp.]